MFNLKFSIKTKHTFNFFAITKLKYALLIITVNDCVLAAENPTSVVAAPVTLESALVVGNSATTERREASAAKIVVTKEELTKYGDTSIATALQRVPGISLAQTSGKEVEIRLRGLGDGYTQILLDGSPVARGFSIESLSPEMVEKIEILKSPTADLAAQAIAGTVNIILKKSNRRSNQSMKLALGNNDDRTNANASFDYGSRYDEYSWSINGAASLSNDHWQDHFVNRAILADGSTLFSRVSDDDERRRQKNLTLAPRIDFKISEKTSLGINALLQAGRTNYSGISLRSQIVGVPPEFVNDTLSSKAKSSQARITTQLKTALGENIRLDNKLIFSSNRRNSISSLTGSDAAGNIERVEAVDSLANEHSASLSGKMLITLKDNHAIATGWDGEIIQRSEDRRQRNYNPAGVQTYQLDEDYTARINRLALFAQDEWSVSPQLNAYFGLRLESLQTRTEGKTIETVSVHSSVLSPVAQILWKIPETKSDQLRINLGRTYKAPTARELVPRRWVRLDNTATTPNYQGNPNLKPELAWGLDVGYERYLSQTEFLGLSAFVRQIDNLILPQTFVENNIWTDSPRNSGMANVQGLELEFKGKIKSLGQQAVNLDYRTSLSRNWSQVKEIPQPFNHLARQPGLTATFAVDWRVDDNLTSGFSYSYQKSGYSRNSLTNLVYTGATKKLDLYTLWEPVKLHRLRLSASNILAPDEIKHSTYVDQEMTATGSNQFKTYQQFKVQYEVSF